MRRKNVLSILIIFIMSLLSITTGYAGTSISLEKDVPRNSLTAVPSTLTFYIYDSGSGLTPIASQTFLAGEWSADYDLSNISMSGAGVVRFTANFTNTETLPDTGDLWVEIEVDGVLKGNREIIKRATYALTAENALNGVPSGFTIMGDTETPPPGYSYSGDYLSVPEGWSPKADMGAIRSAHSAAVVNGKIYISGGYDGGAYLPTTEEYDPVTDTWTPKASMGSIRAYHTATVVNGKIYVSGGYNSAPVATTEEYNPGKQYFIHRKD